MSACSSISVTKNLFLHIGQKTFVPTCAGENVGEVSMEGWNIG